MSDVKIKVDQGFLYRSGPFEPYRKTWYGAGIHTVPMHVARKAVADGNASFYRHQQYCEE